MKESPLSEILLQQMKEKSSAMNLSETCPVLPHLPPFLLKEIPAGEYREVNYHFDEFTSESELKKAFPGADIRKGRPHEIFRFLSGSSDVFLDFEGLGCVLLSREARGGKVMRSRMSEWLHYALSPELWGTEGKWTRFHEQLHKLFEEKNLLEGPSVPGYYPLKSDAIPWEKLPVTGTKTVTTVDLILPWTFSLSDLRRLSAFVHEER